MEWMNMPYGGMITNEGIRFSFASREENCGVILYDKNSGLEIERIAFEASDSFGDLYNKVVSDRNPVDLSYAFYAGDNIVADPKGGLFSPSEQYGDYMADGDMKAYILQDEFDWGEDKLPLLPYADCVGYCAHVRGFTMHASSKVKHNGTFKGFTEKIPYLKELGVNMIEFQPIYEFIEAAKAETVNAYSVVKEEKLNYWGYKKGYYYAPKAHYSSSENAVFECKEMIKALHQNGMECILQFYFPDEISRYEIVNILRFWAVHYHVDGFHLMGNNIPTTDIAKEPVLAKTKIWYYQFDVDAIYEKTHEPKFINLATYQDEYYYALRKYLKGDENMLNDVMYQMRHIPNKLGKIHYLSNYCGFTLMDTYSYERKHNEENGEDNRDGNDYNCSWNCGEEGTTRKKKVTGLRKQLVKNAFALLLLSASTPMFFMGDEFGNSQKGNNNPYCQDNDITWLNWKESEKNKDLFNFVKEIISFRKEHAVLHPEKEHRIMDYLSCGYPDLSYHSKNAWRMQAESYKHHFGMMFCGNYALKADGTMDDYIYVASNMHWEAQELALPRLPKGMNWELCQHTCEAVIESAGNDAEHPAENELVKLIPPRTVAVYIGKQMKTERKGKVKYQDVQSF